MRVPADIGVYGEFGQMLLLAEVRSLDKTTTQWAIEVRQDVLRILKGFVPRYFLVVSRDQSYLWLTAAPQNGAPDRTFVTAALFEPYFRAIRSTVEDISGNALELLVGVWLKGLTRGDVQALSVLPPDLDLAEAVENGRIDFATAA